MITVRGLDDEKNYHFLADTPYAALEKMIYCLNIQSEDKTARINITADGRFLFTVHKGKTYAVDNKER